MTVRTPQIGYPSPLRRKRPKPSLIKQQSRTRARFRRSMRHLAHNHRMIACGMHRKGHAMKHREAPRQLRCPCGPFLPMETGKVMALRGEMIRQSALIFAKDMDAVCLSPSKSIMAFGAQCG